MSLLVSTGSVCFFVVEVLDMADLDGSQNVRVIMRFTAGVQYGIGTDIVLYS